MRSCFRPGLQHLLQTKSHRAQTDLRADQRDQGDDGRRSPGAGRQQERRGGRAQGGLLRHGGDSPGRTFLTTADLFQEVNLALLTFTIYLVTSKFLCT